MRCLLPGGNKLSRVNVPPDAREYAFWDELVRRHALAGRKRVGTAWVVGPARWQPWGCAPVVGPLRGLTRRSVGQIRHIDDFGISRGFKEISIFWKFALWRRFVFKFHRLYPSTRNIRQCACSPLRRAVAPWTTCKRHPIKIVNREFDNRAQEEMTQIPDIQISTIEAGRVLGIHRETVRYHIRQGHLRATRRSYRHYDIPLGELLRFQRELTAR